MRLLSQRGSGMNVRPRRVVGQHLRQELAERHSIDAHRRCQGDKRMAGATSDEVAEIGMRIDLRGQRPGGERPTHWRGENFNDANAARIGEQYFHFALVCWKRSLRGVGLGPGFRLFESFDNGSRVESGRQAVWRSPPGQ